MKFDYVIVIKLLYFDLPLNNFFLLYSVYCTYRKKFFWQQTSIEAIFKQLEMNQIEEPLDELPADLGWWGARHEGDSPGSMDEGVIRSSHKQTILIRCCVGHGWFEKSKADRVWLHAHASGLVTCCNSIHCMLSRCPWVCSVTKHLVSACQASLSFSTVLLACLLQCLSHLVSMLQETWELKTLQIHYMATTINIYTMTYFGHVDEFVL